MSKTRAFSLLMTILALLLAGCGDNSSSTANTPASGETVSLADFPQADGKKTLNEIQQEVGAKQDANLLPAANDFVRGRENRLPFGLFTENRAPIWGPTVIYYATSSTAPAVGPFKAPAHTFNVPAKYQSSTSKADIDTVGNGFYAATIPAVKNAKKLGVLALTKTASGYEAAAVAVPLAITDPAPAPGEKVPAIETPTGTTAAELDAIDTRDPHDDMHRVSLKDALEQKKPIVLVFATPKLCASRVCAPVTDIAEWVHHENGDGVIFIHNEIYNDNDINKGYRSQVKDFGLTSEPFTFVIGADGRVVSQLQGPFDEGELQAAIAEAKRKG
ncbi:MAG: hypothetical protein QM648_08175 [Solirubrobacterales bacterium]